MISINFGGDFYLKSKWIRPDLIDDKLIGQFTDAHYNLINLECPVLDAGSAKAIDKTGPNIFNQRDIEGVLRRLNINTVTLANNHIMDFGHYGLSSTFSFCNSMGIKTVGGGANLKHARVPLILEKNGLQVAILNFAENEWASAKLDESGANPMDPIDNGADIRKACGNFDHVIVVVHGGHEYYPLPSPQMQKYYRYYADCGASLVVGHHTHCISGYEVYNDKPIFYSLGNFLFTMASNRPEWYEGLILNLSIDQNGIKWKLLPIQQERETFRLRLLQNEEEQAALQKVEELSELIGQPDEVLKRWKTFIKESSPYYTKVLSPGYALNKRYGRLIIYVGALLKKFYGSQLFDRQKYFTRLLNHLRCESHRAASIEMLENFLKEKRQ